MSKDDFLGGVMATFREKLVKDAETSLQDHLKTYKQKLENIEKINTENMNKSVEDYHKKRKVLEDKLNQQTNKINEKVNKMITSAASKMDERLTKIDDELLCLLIFTLNLHHLYTFDTTKSFHIT